MYHKMPKDRIGNRIIAIVNFFISILNPIKLFIFIPLNGIELCENHTCNLIIALPQKT